MGGEHAAAEALQLCPALRTGREAHIGRPRSLRLARARCLALGAQRAIALASRLTNIPLTRFRKTAVTAASVIPRMTYPTLWSTPPAATTNTLRTKVVKCVWGLAPSNEPSIHALPCTHMT